MLDRVWEADNLIIMKMKPYFNVAGPCVPGEHYMLPAQERCQGIPELIDRKQYFVIHAAQVFPPDVVDAIFEVTQGQPWLVNAIACEIVEEILHYDTALPILPEYVVQAVETIMQQRGTHIDSLMERLTEERVRKIVEPVILGNAERYDLLDDDYRFVLDLGLLREDDRQLKPANRIYGEIMIRTLNFRTQQEIEDLLPHADLPFYLKEGRLNMTVLLQDFQQFWRENSDIWQEKFDYKEAAPHLILQAFLQRILNNGGHIIREMAGGGNVWISVWNIRTSVIPSNSKFAMIRRSSERAKIS